MHAYLGPFSFILSTKTTFLLWTTIYSHLLFFRSIFILHVSSFSELSLREAFLCICICICNCIRILYVICILLYIFHPFLFLHWNWESGSLSLMFARGKHLSDWTMTTWSRVAQYYSTNKIVNKLKIQYHSIERKVFIKNLKIQSLLSSNVCWARGEAWRHCGGLNDHNNVPKCTHCTLNSLHIEHCSALYFAHYSLYIELIGHCTHIVMD